MNKITTSSTAEYFAKNLQQVGFSSPTKAVLTTLKEAVDNSLDACEAVGILPEITVEIRKKGKGSQKNTDLIEIIVEDNGPGLEADDLAKVFGEYLASSKFGRGQCSRGQQGIGISAATTWAQLTNAKGVVVTSKTNRMRKAIHATVNVDIKGNKGILKNKEAVEWPEKDNGIKVEFRIDGRAQLNGDSGLITYLEGTALLNPHLNLKYKLLDNEWEDVARVSEEIPKVPPPVNPHPHTMKLGEFMTHAHLYAGLTVTKWLRTAFSRVSENNIKDFVKSGFPKTILTKPVKTLSQDDFKKAYSAIQNTELMAPSTKSVLTIGEESLAKSIYRMGEVDFFSVVTRKPKICDFKPVVIEVAIARFLDRGESDAPVRVLRFANRVPLQFDKGACAVTKAIESVNWRSYGLSQPKGSVPQGPYVFAVSVVSPFIKFKNASKETIDSSDELVDEIRRALMQAGQKLSRHIKREAKAADLERKISHIEKFGPILVDTLARITGAPDKRRLKAQEGLQKILGRDTNNMEQDLQEAEEKLQKLQKKMVFNPDDDGSEDLDDLDLDMDLDMDEEVVKTTKKKATKKATKKAATKKVAAKKKVSAKKTTTKKSATKKAAKKK